jgi:hypothetical protein
MRFRVKRPVTIRLISIPAPMNRQEDKPRSAGPRGGDQPLRLSALWRQSPNETQAKRRLQPNRRAEGAAQRCAAGLRP